MKKDYKDWYRVELMVSSNGKKVDVINGDTDENGDIKGFKPLNNYFKLSGYTIIKTIEDINEKDYMYSKEKIKKLLKVIKEGLDESFSN